MGHLIRYSSRNTQQTMTDALEKRLIEALKNVDAHGDVAPSHVHDPMTMLLRDNAIQANLMRWDHARGSLFVDRCGPPANYCAESRSWHRHILPEARRCGAT
jgi:hypothetical protein